MLLVAVVLGAVAGGLYASLPKAMEAMTRIDGLSAPTSPSLRDFHRAKRAVYGRMRQLDRDSRAIMRDRAEVTV